MLRRNAHKVFRKARLNQGLSQSRIASKLGVGQSTVSRIERNLPTTVDTSFWIRAVLFMGIYPLDVFRECSCVYMTFLESRGMFCANCGFIHSENWPTTKDVAV